MNATKTHCFLWPTQATERVYDWISTRPRRVAKWEEIAQGMVDGRHSYGVCIECMAYTYRESLEVDYDDDEIAAMFGDFGTVDWEYLADHFLQGTESPYRELIR